MHKFSNLSTAREKLPKRASFLDERGPACLPIHRQFVENTIDNKKKKSCLVECRLLDKPVGYDFKYFYKEVGTFGGYDGWCDFFLNTKAVLTANKKKNAG